MGRPRQQPAADCSKPAIRGDLQKRRVSVGD